MLWMSDLLWTMWGTEVKRDGLWSDTLQPGPRGGHGGATGVGGHRGGGR